MNDLAKNLLLWVIVAVVLMVVFQAFGPRAAGSDPLAYNVFVQEVQQDRVKEVKIADDRSSLYPRPSRVISRVPRPWPVLSLWPSTRAREQSRRSASSSCPISRLTNSTAVLRSMATCSQIFRARAVLPMLGRAARMINCCGWKPAVMSSSS